jgi:hypothetical protein
LIAKLNNLYSRALEKTITKDILRNKLYSGERPAIELLYTRYSGMLFSYVLQFVPERAKAEELLVDIFAKLSSRLQEACESNLSIYCWLQVEARKIILEYKTGRENGYSGEYYASLLNGATLEQQWVFRELFLHGKDKGELALQAGKDPADIAGLLRESLLIIRKRLV